MTFRSYFAALLVLLVASTGWAKSALDKDVLIMGTAPTLPPFTFINADGSLAGIDIQIMEELKLKLGREIEVKQMEFGALIPSMIAGKIDFILGCLSHTPERAKRIDYTRPYYITPPDAFVVKRETEGIDRIEDLQGKIVACIAGTTHNAFLDKKNEELKFAAIKPFPTNDDILREVEIGRADVAYTDGNVARKILRDPDSKLKVAFRHQALTADKICIAVRKGDTEFRDALDRAIDEMEEEEKLYEFRIMFDLE